MIPGVKRNPGESGVTGICLEFHSITVLIYVSYTVYSVLLGMLRALRDRVRATPSSKQDFVVLAKACRTLAQRTMYVISPAMHEKTCKKGENATRRRRHFDSAKNRPSFACSHSARSYDSQRVAKIYCTELPGRSIPQMSLVGSFVQSMYTYFPMYVLRKYTWNVMHSTLSCNIVACCVKNSYLFVLLYSASVVKKIDDLRMSEIKWKFFSF